MPTMWQQVISELNKEDASRLLWTAIKDAP